MVTYCCSKCGSDLLVKENPFVPGERVWGVSGTWVQGHEDGDLAICKECGYDMIESIQDAFYRREDLSNQPALVL